MCERVSAFSLSLGAFESSNSVSEREKNSLSSSDSRTTLSRHDRVNLVDEQDDARAVLTRLFALFDHRFQSLFELSLVTRARRECAHVERPQATEEVRWYVSSDDCKGGKEKKRKKKKKTRQALAKSGISHEVPTYFAARDLQRLKSCLSLAHLGISGENKAQ